MSEMKIFISHSHDDNGFCQKLVDALRQSTADVNVWYDDYNLGSGHLLDTIEKELRNRPVFIPILSPAALKSQWVRNEASWAFNRYQREPERIILPVMAQAVEPDDIWMFLEPFKRIEAQYGVPYPHDVAIQKTLDALYLGKGNATTAIDEQASFEELAKRTRLLSMRGRFQEAYECGKRALLLQPGDMEMSFEVGQNLRHMGKLEEMRQLFVDCLRFQPHSAIQWRCRAGMQMLLHEGADALESIETSLRLDEGSYRAWNTIGNIFVDLKRYDEALSAFDTSLSFDPTNSDIWGNRAITLTYLEHYHAALASAEIALRYDHENITAQINRGWALLGLSRYTAALENSMDVHSKGHTEDGQSTGLAEPESWYCGAFALFCLGRNEEGEFWLSKSKQLSSALLDVPFEYKDGSLVAVH